jgi:hypothetical protein
MYRVAVVFVSLVALAGASVESARVVPSDSLVTRFHAKQLRMPSSYRALRHLEAENRAHNKAGWLDVMTEFASGTMTYTVTARGGSELIQNRVLLAALKAERDMLKTGRAPFAWTETNYRLEDAEPEDGLPRIRIMPKRENKFLIDGWLFLTPDADVVQMAGKLSKNPSFWTRNVTMDQRYTTIGGVHLPLSVASVADVRFYGRSTFEMTYAYEMIDGANVTVGTSDHSH